MSSQCSKNLLYRGEKIVILKCVNADEFFDFSLGGFVLVRAMREEDFCSRAMQPS